MKWIWIPFVIVGSGLALMVILRPEWGRRGHQLTHDKREKIKDQGMTILGACAIIAWPGLFGEDFPYVFGPIGLLWLIVNFKTITRDLPSASVSVAVFLWMILSLAFRYSN